MDVTERKGRPCRINVGGEWVPAVVTKVEQPTGTGGAREPMVEAHIPHLAIQGVRYSVRRKLSDVKFSD